MISHPQNPSDAAFARPADGPVSGAEQDSTEYIGTELFRRGQLGRLRDLGGQLCERAAVIPVHDER